MATLLTGGTGFVGKELIPLLSEVAITTRSPIRARKSLGNRVAQYIEWDPSDDDFQLEPDHQFDQVVNLMGESIAEGRWNAAKKKRMKDLRKKQDEMFAELVQVYAEKHGMDPNEHVREVPEGW